MKSLVVGILVGLTACAPLPREAREVRYAQADSAGDVQTDAATAAVQPAPAPHAGGTPDEGHCYWLENQKTTFGWLSKGSAFLAGASGVGTVGAVASQDVERRADGTVEAPSKALPITLSIVTIIAGTTAVVTGFIADARADRFRRINCK